MKQSNNVVVMWMDRATFTESSQMERGMDHFDFMYFESGDCT